MLTEEALFSLASSSLRVVSLLRVCARPLRISSLPLRRSSLRCRTVVLWDLCGKETCSPAHRIQFILSALPVQASCTCYAISRYTDKQTSMHC